MTDPATIQVSPSRVHSVWGRLRRILLNKGVLSVFDQGVVSAANFVTSVVIGRVCGKEELGVYFLALSVLYFVRGVQDQMLAGPYTVYSPRRSGRKLATYTGSVLVHQLGLSTLTVLGIGLFLLAVIAGYGPASIGSTLGVLALAAPLMLLREYARRHCFARFHYATVIGVDALVSCLQIGGLAALYATGMLSAAGMYLVLGVACGLACGVWLMLHYREISIRYRRVLSDWWFNWKFGRWALMGQLVGCSAPYILPWIVVASHGESSAGVMAACTSITGIANTFVIGVANYISPRAASAFNQGGAPALKKVLATAAVVFTMTVGGFSLLTLVAGDWMLSLIYGGAYQGAGLVLAMYAGAMLANAYKITAGNGLWAIERPDANFAADVAALIVSLGLAAWLTPLFGVAGAAAATLVGTGLDAAIRAATLLRFMPTATHPETATA